MEETIQINMRLPKQMVCDIEYITQNLNLNRNDWIKVKLAELISQEITNQKLMIIEKLEREYIWGKIDDKQFQHGIGFKPTDKLKQERKRHKMFVERGTILTQDYLMKKAGVKE